MGTVVGMGILRKFAYAGIAKKLYDESRKPENQERIRAAKERLRDRRRKSG